MRETTRYTNMLLLDPFLDGLTAPFILPVVKFWVDQKLDPILFGYAVGAEALLTLVFYQILEWRQRGMRKALRDPSYIAEIPYPVVIVATIAAYIPVVLYFLLGVNGYFVVALFTGSLYFFCVRNHLRSLKRRLFTLEERELFDRKADTMARAASIFSLLLLSLIFIDPAALNPVTALISCFFVSDVGLLSGFTYFYCVQNRNKREQTWA
jgi:hypothetical protein